MYLYMKYIKLFTDHNNYQNFIESQDSLQPNISFCKTVRHIHFNPEETRLIAIFNITDTTNPTTITNVNGWDDIESVEITSPTNNVFTLTANDLVEYDSISGIDPLLGYQFTETGNFTFKYTFKPNVHTIPTNLFNYIPYVKRVEIPYVINIIGNNAFVNCTNLETVVMTDSITIINDQAFLYCTKLENIILPESLTSIGEYAFQNCEKLQSISIPDSVTSIGMSAFENCIVLRNVKLSNNITTLSERLFYSCLQLWNLTIPASVNNIELDALRFGQDNEVNYGINITVLTTTPPILDSNAQIGRSGGSFYYTKIHVPAESLDTYKAATGWSNYSNHIVAI